VIAKSAAPHQVVLLPGNMCDGRLWAGGDGAILKAIEACGLVVSHVNFASDASIETMAHHALTITEGTLIPIGFSMGGIVALEMYKQAPNRIAAIGLIATTSQADTRGLERLRQQRDVRRGHLERVVLEELKPNYLAACHAKDADLLALLRDMALALGPEVFIAQSEALRTRAELTPVLGDIKVPVMLACGREDTLCPPQRHEQMAAMIKGANLTIVEDAGHILPLEQPAILARLLSNFLTSTLGAKP
jgi:pimeloyl-ACP methyl ester carboxylesterase